MVSLAGVTGVADEVAIWMRSLNGSRLMAISFGGFHLIYGALIVTTARRDELPA